MQKMQKIQRYKKPDTNYFIIWGDLWLLFLLFIGLDRQLLY
jgi:hypothetical protein